MKAQILKIAGVKNEKEFYKKFPTEEAFMKKHGKALEKAQLGAKMPGQMPVNAPNLPTLENTFSSTPGFGATAKAYAKNLGNDVLKGVNAVVKPVDLSTPSGLAGMIGGIGAGINTIKQTKKNIGELEKYGKVSDVVLQAANSRPERVQNKYIRPEDNLVQNINPLGSGTNYLAARNGTEIQNTYAPNDIYTDLGYEPLNDSNVKQYKKGGKLKKAQAGEAVGIANTLADVSKQSGQLGGLLGSQFGGAGGETGGYTQMLGSFGILGGIAGGLLDAPMLKKKQQAQSYLDKNTGLISGINQLDNFAQQNSGFMENGGYMNPEYNPQMIAKFGDYSMDQLLAPPNDADMLRSGGHLAQVNYTPPSAQAMYTGRNQMEYGGQMAMGGDLQVYRGKAETISYNPFLPNGGETVMFRGPSHDNGGMPISYGENGVEVEGGEPAQIMQDGGDMQNGNDEGNLLVFGNLIKPGTNQKFKNYIADLSNIEAKQNKLVEKTTTLINDTDTNDQFDKLSLNTGQANLIGANMKLKDIAGKKKEAAAEQNAILDTAKEFGVESDALAKGKIKYAKANDPYAKFGAKLEIAQKGKQVKKYDPEFESFINQAMQLEQANSSAAGNYRGGGSNFGTNNSAYNTPEKAKEYYYNKYWSKVKDLPAGLRTRALQMAINTGDPYGELMVAAGKMSVDDRYASRVERKNKVITGNKDWEANKVDILKAYKEDPQGFLAKLDNEQNRYYDGVVANNDFGINKDTVREFLDDYTGLARFASQPYIPQKQVAQNVSVPATPNNYSIGIGSTLEGSVGLSPIAERQPSAYIPNLNDQIINAQINQREQGNTMLDDVQVVASKNNMGQFPSPTDEDGNYYMPITQEASPLSPPSPSPMLQTLQSPTYYSEDYEYKGDAKDSGKDDRMSWDAIGQTALSALYPFIKPRAARPLDPNQLAPEMLASAMNQQEPVRAQLYNPMLTQATSISLQDQLNEVTAQTRDAMRMAQGDPSALSMIASQAQQAKSKILGEQLRMNQGEKQRVNDQNINTLNNAQMTNLGILDQQYVRQATGDSKTKEQKIAIAKSIADKIAQNKRENMEATVMENMYPAFNFTQDGVAYKNPMYMASFAPYGSGSGTGYGAGQMPAGMIPEYGTDETTGKPKIIGYKFPKETKSVKRNGAIVKAIKGL